MIFKKQLYAAIYGALEDAQYHNIEYFSVAYVGSCSRDCDGEWDWWDIKFDVSFINEFDQQIPFNLPQLDADLKKSVADEDCDLFNALVDDLTDAAIDNYDFTL